MSIHLSYDFGRLLRRCGYRITSEHRSPEIHVRRTETYRFETNDYWWIATFQGTFAKHFLARPC